MTNNDMFKRMLYLTGISRDLELVVHILELGGVTASKSKIKGWRTVLYNPRSSPMSDCNLEAFFDGFFAYRDNEREKGNIVFAFDINLGSERD